MERGRGGCWINMWILHRETAQFIRWKYMCQTLKTQTETWGRCVCGYEYGLGNCENGLSSRCEERKNICLCHVNQNLRNVSLSQGQNGP